MTLAKAWDKYGDYGDIIKAAGRTNKGWNLLGVYEFSAGMTNRCK